MEVKVGYKIKVVNSGGMYTTYQEFYDRYKTEKTLPYNKSKSGLGDKSFDECIGTVMAVAKHGSNRDETIAIVNIESENEAILISVRSRYIDIIEDTTFSVKELIKDKIVGESYMKMGNKTMICLLTLSNGFEVVGHEACVDPNKFDFELGKKYAYENAFNKLYELEGYLLQSSLK